MEEEPEEEDENEEQNEDENDAGLWDVRRNSGHRTGAGAQLSGLGDVGISADGTGGLDEADGSADLVFRRSCGGQ